MAIESAALFTGSGVQLSEVLDVGDDPTYISLYERARAMDLAQHPEEGLEMEECGAEEVEQTLTEGDTLDRLIDISLEKVHHIQTHGRRDERRRVLVVNTLHHLLLSKMEAMQHQMEIGDGQLVPRSKGEAATMLNRMLQEKIATLGYGRTVRIWVEPPKRPGGNATINVPQKAKRQDDSKEESPASNNLVAPSDREKHRR